MQRAQVATVGQAMPDKLNSETPPRLSRPVRHSLNYRSRRGITLVEMLIAVAITLVIMAAVVTAFATISDSVQQRRATGEMSNSLRHARNVLQRDLAGVTCNMLPWQKPEWNHGYFELIEGPYCDFFASALIDSGAPDLNGELDYELSAVPSSNLLQQGIANGLPARSVTDGRALGDYDDILMFTSRNEREPFVGRVPDNTNSDFPNWTSKALKSPLAEVVWFSVENPADAPDGRFDPADYFGEPGFRTVYRRTLLIAPWLDPYRRVDNNDRVIETYPGVVRFLPSRIGIDQIPTALACLVAFQERYDLSVRLEWDPLLNNNRGGWKIVANTLSDLTKRENRYEHHGFLLQGNIRSFPFAAASTGIDYTSNQALRFVVDPEIGAAATQAQGQAIKHPNFRRIDRFALNSNQLGSGYRIRPFVYVDDSNATAPATVRALVNSGDTPNAQQVVYVTAGLVPLGGERRGEDVMLTDALAFDLRVYDPGAPLLGPRNQNLPDVVVEPGDAGWSEYLSPQNIGNTAIFGYGSYVDLGFLSLHSVWKGQNAVLPMPTLDVFPQFATSPRTRSGLNLWGTAGPFFEPYRVYDTWSFHYENNGLDEDGDGMIDEGTNGFDDLAEYDDPSVNPPTVIDRRFGVDDAGERETSPPYDVPLRGIQVRLRAYERDSRQVREVSVKQHFVPE